MGRFGGDSHWLPLIFVPDTANWGAQALDFRARLCRHKVWSRWRTRPVFLLEMLIRVAFRDTIANGCSAEQTSTRND